MKLTIDDKQKITIGFTFLLEFYKVLMGTFLIPFVPQICDDHNCSMSEIITKTSPMELSGNILNGLTFLFVAYFYYNELRREYWCVQYLDIDETKPNDNLDTEIEEYKKIKLDMKKINKSYKNSIHKTVIILCVNFLYSTTVIAFNYSGINTITSIVSYIILIASKLNSSYTISNESVNKERAFSAFMKTPKTFNVIDADYSKSNDIKKVEKQNYTKEVCEDEINVNVNS